jgi:hypothetical protein
LRWEQRGELHVEPRSRSLHIILTLLHGLCVYGRNVCSSRMSITISTHRELILSIGTVGESCIAVRWFRGMAGESVGSRCTGPVLGTGSLRLLHPEKMRWQDKAVPHKR